MIPQETLDRFADVIRRARAAGNTKVLAEATDLLGQVLRQNAGEAPVSRQISADPLSRAHAREADGREADGLHKLRKGRDRCSATRRDGEPCQAPAIEGGTVCRKHGGSAPQVAIAAKHVKLLEAAYVAHQEWEQARDFDALCAALAAQREFDAYETKMALVAELRAELKQRKAAARGDAAAH